MSVNLSVKTEYYNHWQSEQSVIILRHPTNVRLHNNALPLQVKDKSSAVLLSEITKFVLPGIHILSDAMTSHQPLSQMGYTHGVVVHQRHIVNPEDPSVHTQNVEIRNQWTKKAILNYGNTRRINSYCATYAYQLAHSTLFKCRQVDTDITGIWYLDMSLSRFHTSSLHSCDRNVTSGWCTGYTIKFS